MGKDERLNGITSGWLNRSLKTASLGRDLAAELAKNRLRRVFSKDAQSLDDSTREKLAALITEQTGKLKGLSMKVGQILSYMDTSLPEPARKILATLQDSTPPMASAVVRRIIKEELGDDPDKIFLKWDDRPIAAASIGQVHRAVSKDGRELAIKVQYPEIRQALDADFKSLGALGAVLDMVLPGGASHVIEELKERLGEECNYRYELKNLEHFRSIFKDTPGVKFPEVFPEFNTERILATEFIHGLKFADFVAQSTQVQRDIAGETIYKIIYHSIFKHHCFNGDPHPGNYLFTEDGVAFLDFGCVKYWTTEFMVSQRRLIHANLSCDVNQFRQATIDEGIVVRPNGYDFHRYMRAGLAISHPYLFDEDFTFSPEFVTRMNECLWKSLSVKTERLPKDLTFVNRVWWGLYSVLAALNATFNAHSIVKPLLYDNPLDFPKVPRHLVPTLVES